MSVVWDPGQDWIQIFDRLLKHPQGPTRGCRCDICTQGTPDCGGAWTDEGEANVSRASRASTEERDDDGGAEVEAGALDEESFQRAFESCSPVSTLSLRSVNSQLAAVLVGLSSRDWRKRVEGLSLLRSLVMSGASEHQDFPSSLLHLQRPLVSCVQDLRSQVVKEACLSLACLAQQLQHRAEHLLQPILPSLLLLLQSGARVVTSSGVTAVRFILHNCFCPGFITVVCRGSSSRSNLVRRHTFQFLQQILHVWPLHKLEGLGAEVGAAVRRGMGDGEPSTRAEARKAYWAFGDTFRLEADGLLSSLESADIDIHRSRQSSVGRSRESLGEEGSSGLVRRGSVRVRRSQEKADNTNLRRSNSLVDDTAARRAIVRQQFSQEGRSQAALQRRGSLRRGSGEGSSPGVLPRSLVDPPSLGSIHRRGSTEPEAKNVPRRGSTDFATPSAQSSRRGSKEAASPSVSRRGCSKEPTTPVSLRQGSGEPSRIRRSFRRGSAEPSSPQVMRRGLNNEQRMVRGGSVEPASPKTFRSGSRDSSTGSSFGILRRGSTQPTSSQPLSKVSKEVSSPRRGPAVFNASSSSSLAAEGRIFNSNQDKGTSGHGSKKVIFCSMSSKEYEHPQANDSSQESASSKDFHLHSVTTPPRIDFSSAEDGTCMGSSSTRLSSPSPTRSSGSPDSGYSTIELEPGSRALSLARLAVRVRDGEGEEVVAALHLLARLLDGTWGEEEAKVGSQIAPLLVESYGAEETQVRKAALTCLVSLCLQVGEDHLAPHLAGLPGAKRKLLSLHLHRARTNQKGR